MGGAPDGAHFLVHGDTGEIANVLIGAGEDIKEGGVAAVLIACQCKNHTDSSLSVIFAASSRRMVSS